MAAGPGGEEDRIDEVDLSEDPKDQNYWLNPESLGNLDWSGIDAEVETFMSEDEHGGGGRNDNGKESGTRDTNGQGKNYQEENGPDNDGKSEKRTST